MRHVLTAGAAEDRSHSSMVTVAFAVFPGLLVLQTQL
jgi:hypothetical protein